MRSPRVGAASLSNESDYPLQTDSGQENRRGNDNLIWDEMTICRSDDL